MARILVVDDEDGLREFLCDTLEAAGHTVERASDGEMAYRILNSQAFHVLVTDLKMPGIDGMELVRRTRREQPEMEIVVLTAHGSVAGAVEAMKLGAFDYLEKPIPSPAALRLVVDRALERRGLHAIEEHVAEASTSPRLGYGSRVMQDVETALRKVALTDATVLLLGESGTGKEVAARFVHANSKRAKGQFVAVNCATLSEQLLESELFGHEKGAFSGAIAKKRGKLELAEGGTFFLDEVGEMKIELQTKLLRVLQERRFERVGGTCSIDADARFIAATNRDLMNEIHAGRFREDLYHRLAVFPVRMPPLRERPEDVSQLTDALLARIARDLGRPGLSLDERARTAIVAANFPGNVRELRNALERAAILSESTKLTLDDMTRVLHGNGHEKHVPAAADAPTMEEAEQGAIRRALAQCGGNRKKAAEHLGIGLRTLYEKLKKYGIR